MLYGKLLLFKIDSAVNKIWLSLLGVISGRHSAWLHGTGLAYFLL